MLYSVISGLERKEDSAMDSTKELIKLIRKSKSPEKAIDIAITAIRQFLNCCGQSQSIQAASLAEQDEED